MKGLPLTTINMRIKKDRTNDERKEPNMSHVTAPLNNLQWVQTTVTAPENW